MEVELQEDGTFYLPPFVINDFDPLMPQSQTLDWGMVKLNIPTIHSAGITGKGVKVAVIDSTPEYSPLIIKDENGKLYVVSISELFETIADKETTVTDKGEYIRKVRGYKVFSGHSNVQKRWQTINYVLCHEYSGLIKKINTGTGLVDVTPNHSVISANGQEVDAKSLAIDQKLAFSDTKIIKQNLGGKLFIGNEELAWLYGFFAAEGSSYFLPERSRYIVIISQKDVKQLEKAKRILEEQLNCISYIGNDYGNGSQNLICPNKDLYFHVRDILYCKQEKRVPAIILNAPENIRYAFLKGYNEGDGATWSNHKKPFEFSQFTTKSQVLACGLSLLIDLTLDQTYSVYTREDKPNIIQISLDQPKEIYEEEPVSSDSDVLIVKQKALKKRLPNVIKKIIDIDYTGLVYDLETEDHTFACGIGQLKLHNTYISPSHPDMVGAVIKEINTTPEQYTVQQNGHGQGTSGIIGARDNGSGVLGVAPDCQIIAIKSMRETGSGDMNEIIAGIDAAIAEGAHIINMSLGTSADVPAMRAAVLRATTAGILVVCSAGNAGQDNSVMYPAKYENTIAIAASNTNGKISAFSSRGWDVDLCAPGEKVLTGWKDNTWAVVSGTSFSAPYVSGCLALLLEAKQLITLGRLEDTAIDIEDPGRDQKAGYGLISPAGFLAKYNVQPPPPPPPPPGDPYAKVKQAKQLLTDFLSAIIS